MQTVSYRDVTLKSGFLYEKQLLIAPAERFKLLCAVAERKIVEFGAALLELGKETVVPGQPADDRHGYVVSSGHSSKPPVTAAAEEAAAALVCKDGREGRGESSPYAWSRSMVAIT